jgi:hypothetical protein
MAAIFKGLAGRVVCFKTINITVFGFSKRKQNFSFSLACQSYQLISAGFPSPETIINVSLLEAS